MVEHLKASAAEKLNQEQIQPVVTGFQERDPFAQKFQFEFPKFSGAEWNSYSSELLELLVYLKEFLSYYNKIATLFRGGEFQKNSLENQLSGAPDHNLR